MCLKFYIIVKFVKKKTKNPYFFIRIFKTSELKERVNSAQIMLVSFQAIKQQCLWPGSYLLGIRT